MPYGNKSAYEAQAKLKGQSPAYKKSSGFKMKGSPLKQEEVVSQTSPGPGWTKTIGTNIWSPPTPQKKEKYMKKMTRRRKNYLTKTPTLGPKKLPV